jgi:hypothetical protein
MPAFAAHSLSPASFFTPAALDIRGPSVPASAAHAPFAVRHDVPVYRSGPPDPSADRSIRSTAHAAAPGRRWSGAPDSHFVGLAGGLKGGGGDAGASGNVKELWQHRRTELEGKRAQMRARENELTVQLNGHPPPDPIETNRIQSELVHVRRLLESYENELRHLPQAQ